MSIHDILDDIKEDTLNDIDTSLVANETIKPEPVVTQGSKVFVKSLDENVLQKFNTLYKRCLLRKTIGSLTKIDKAIAVEAMATLPYNNPINEAKLTNTASSINKKIVDEIVFSEKDEMPAELHEILKETLTTFNEELLKEISDCRDFIEDFLTKTRELVNSKIKTSIVIFDNQSYNLITTSLNTIAYVLKDTELSYEKYEGSLNAKAKAILKPELYSFLETLKEICSGEERNDSLIYILERLSLTSAIVKSIHQSAEIFIKNAEYYIKQDNRDLTGAASDAVTSLQSAIKSLETYNKLKDYTCEECGYLKEILEYLEFID